LPTSGVWTVNRALAVLQSGIDSEDPSLRTAAFVAWISSGDPSAAAIVARAANDPSPIVQRALARQFPQRFSAPLQSRVSSDPIALAWLAFSGETVASSDSSTPDLLIRSLQGDKRSERQLLERIADGWVPADSGFFELMSQMKLEGLGQAFLDGVERSEAEVQVSMALVAFSLGMGGAENVLTKLLDDAEDPADHFWAIEAMVRSRVRHSMGWLRQGRKSSDHALALYFRLALASFGEEGPGVVLEAIKTGDRDTRAWAIECLAWMFEDRPLPREMIAILQGSARDETGVVRLRAAQLISDKFGLQYVPLIRRPVGGEPDSVSLFVAGRWLAKNSGVDP